jgi:TPR repeat protein
LELFEKAAAKENSGAMFALGTLNSGGHNLPVDRRVAQRWFRAAAERGHGHAHMMLGRYLVKRVAGELNPVEGRLWLERAIAQGMRRSQTLRRFLTSDHLT